MFSKWRQSLKNEDGVSTGSIILIVGGFASVAIIATLWIGNTTAGLAADTANCVVRAVGPTQVDPNCASNGATGAGGGNAAAADLSRPLPQNWISDFGSGSGKYDVAKLNQAKGNLERGMLRFSGLKLTLYSDIQGSLTKLKNASTKDVALEALQELRVTMYSAQRDGETSTSDSTIQVAANLFREIKHPAYDIAQEAQRNAQNGNLDVRDAYASVGSGIDKYSSMTLAQLKALAPGIDASVKSSGSNYNTAVGQLKEAIAIVDANR